MEKNHETWPAPRKPQGTWPQKYLLTDQMLELNYPTRKPQGAGARRYLPTNPTACGCEEVDAAVPLAGRGMEGLLHEDSPFHLPWPLAAYQSFYTKTLPFTPPGNC